jgi:isopenicillin N synthase-like dioxygenase
MTPAIPQIGIAGLFKGPGPERDQVDHAILEAARHHGFMTVTGLPETIAVHSAARTKLLRIFALPEPSLRALWRQKFEPSNHNVYRGWFPRQDAAVTYKEGIDIGPDCAHGAEVVDPLDPLREATPLPAETSLPGWRSSVGDYYRGMELTARSLMRSISRGLGLPEMFFDGAFEGGISTLRLIHYPERSPAQLATVTDPELWAVHRGHRHYVSGRAHVDSGFVTLLAQDGVPGLQARHHDGSWIDVLPQEETLAVNFGKLLERWTDGEIKATEHRVIGTGEPRCSIPFFYEPRVDAEIAPLPLPQRNPFEPFLYGDYLWAAMTKFVEFQGMEELRPPRLAR